ncbi:MAG: hypothetical protein QW613_00900, partial [Thermoprotei archaeon]
HTTEFENRHGLHPRPVAVIDAGIIYGKMGSSRRGSKHPTAKPFYSFSSPGSRQKPIYSALPIKKFLSEPSLLVERGHHH